MKTYSSPKDIRVAVVGYGGAFNMGRAHLKEMKAAGMTPSAVVEIDRSRLEVAKTDFPGIATFDSVEKMLRADSADLVVLITPHNTHAPLTLQCLRAGRHVICEKPLAITTAEVDKMISSAKKHGLLLSTYHNRHWDGRILQAVEIVKRKNTLGDVIRITAHMGGYSQPQDWWRSSRSISGGILYDWGVHLLEYSFQIIDAPMTEVSGFAHTGFWAPKTKWKEDTNEDEGFAVVRFKGGQWLTLTMSTVDSNPKPGWLEITGTKGTLVLDGSHSTLHQQIKDRSVTTRLPNPPDEGASYYKNIAGHLVGKEDLVITPEWSRRPVHVLDLAVRSAKANKTLPVKYA